MQTKQTAAGLQEKSLGLKLRFIAVSVPSGQILALFIKHSWIVNDVSGGTTQLQCFNSSIWRIIYYKWTLYYTAQQICDHIGKYSLQSLNQMKGKFSSKNSQEARMFDFRATVSLCVETALAINRCQGVHAYELSYENTIRNVYALAPATPLETWS